MIPKSSKVIDSIVGPDVVIDEYVVIKRSWITGKTVIGRGTSIDESFLDDCTIGSGCELSQVKIEAGAKIGDRCTIVGSNIMEKAVIGDRVSIGRQTRIGASCVIGDESFIGAFVRVVGYYTIGKAVNIMNRAFIRANIGDCAVVAEGVAVGGDVSTNSREFLSGRRSKDFNIQINPLGSRQEMLHIWFDKELRFSTGCFTGNEHEFRKAVMEAHGDSKIGRDYLATIDYAKTLLGES